MTTKLLVYGTLKSDGALHSILKTGKFLGEYITKSKGYAMSSAGGNSFPFVYYTNPQNPYRLKGELYEVDVQTLFAAKQVELSAGYEFKELDDDIWGFLYPKQIGNYSNNIQVNEEEKYIEWLNF